MIFWLACVFFKKQELNFCRSWFTCSHHRAQSEIAFSTFILACVRCVQNSIIWMTLIREWSRRPRRSPFRSPCKRRSRWWESRRSDWSTWASRRRGKPGSDTPEWCPAIWWPKPYPHPRFSAPSSLVPGRRDQSRLSAQSDPRWTSHAAAGTCEARDRCRDRTPWSRRTRPRRTTSTTDSALGWSNVSPSTSSWRRCWAPWRE